MTVHPCASRTRMLTWPALGKKNSMLEAVVEWVIAKRVIVEWVDSVVAVGHNPRG